MYVCKRVCVFVCVMQRLDLIFIKYTHTYVHTFLYLERRERVDINHN